MESIQEKLFPSNRFWLVALSPDAKEDEILADRPRGDRRVFPSVQGKPLKVLALSHAVRHNREHFWIEPFRPHDLRRTQASNLAALDVDRFLIERILNHADHSIGAVYDRFQYGPQMRRALEKWERRLRGIIGEPLDFLPTWYCSANQPDEPRSRGLVLLGRSF